MNKLYIFFFNLIAVTCILTGCTSINFTRSPVGFPHPDKYFSFAPIKNLKKPVILRFKMPEGSFSNRYIQYTDVFSRIENNKGIKISSVQVITRKIKKIRKNVFRIKEIIEDKDKKVHIEKFYTMSDRGRIINFHYGKGKTESGKYIISLWQREAMLPKKPVSQGDTWIYKESLQASVSSWWLSQKPLTPDTITAHCKFTGFVKHKNSVCAVIEIRIFKKLKRKTKTLLKTITTESKIFLTQSLYFNIKEGRIEAAISRINGYTSGEDVNLFDFSKGQIILKYDENKNLNP